ncbi:MAG: TIGR01212 family radical SAM protein [Lachnospiraceae bacterium]
MLNEHELYNKYSDYLKEKYGEKVYKLPINLPVSCPNRLEGSGCSFCAENGTGFEAYSNQLSVTNQLTITKEKITKKYKAKKYIAYFQNFTNTFLPLQEFKKYMVEAALVSDVVQLSISTRPDCITKEYLDVLNEIQDTFHMDINIELGIQTANYHTLKEINRGHSLAEFIDAMLQIKAYSFTTCAHVILNLPGDNIDDSIETAKIISALGVDIVKIHSLYIAHNTVLCNEYKSGRMTICSKEEYIHRLICFVEYLNPEIVIERMFSRIPKEDSIFSNWGTSWWKLQEEVLLQMQLQQSFQGKCFHYLNGAALKKLP